MRWLFLSGALVVACSNDTFVAPSDAAAGDACTPSACKGANCANFDQGTESPFSDHSSSGGSTKVTGNQFVSCPNSLESDLDPNASTTPALAVASLATVGTGVTSAHAVLEAAVWLPSVSQGDTVVALTLRAGASDVVQVAYSSSNGWVLYASASSQAVAMNPIPATGRWNHLTLDVRFSSDGNTGTAVITYESADGQPSSAKILDRTTQQNIVPPIGADLGLIGVKTNEKLTSYYDDVSLTVN